MMGEAVKNRQDRKTDMPQLEYQTVCGIRHGYLVSDDGRGMIVRLIGDSHNTHLTQAEVKYITIKGVPDA